MNITNVVLRALYWFVAGSLIGVGVIAILSIGIFLVVAGVVLAVIGAVRGWAREIWAGVIGAGLAPMLILLIDLQGRDSIQPASTAEAYQTMAIVFGAIALLGIIIGVVIEGSRLVRQARVM